MWPLLAAGLIGLGKSELIDRPRERRMRRLEAQTQRFSPWTGMQADGVVQEADPIGTAMSYGIAGQAMADNIAEAGVKKEINEVYLDNIKRGQQMPRGPALTPQASLMPSLYGSNPFGLSNTWGSLNSAGY